PHSDLPVPRPLTPFEEYHGFCSISPDDKQTQHLLHKYNFINFKLFLSSEVS
ncbi:hypothetical protein DFH28DRAFT_831949, partial [Melampsora americana]